MKELDSKDLKINIVAAFPLVENSVSGNSYRPSDIIKAYNGKTVDVINTDAE
jgi:leucyl aminopeptidase